MFCILTGLIDAVRTFILGLATAQGLMMIKLLRLARLARLVRPLRYDFFMKLKLMVDGVIAGVRVLRLAIFLLFGVIFGLGILTRVRFGTEPRAQQEFSTVPKSMSTIVRCFTDGCSTYGGQPLQDVLFEELGWPFLIGYCLTIVFVTIGLFNLIMAFLYTL